MEIVVNSLLPRLVTEPSIHTWRTHPYAGKNNLLKQLPKLFRAYSNWLSHSYGENYRIIVIVDQDHDDCIELKQRILSWSQETSLIEHTTVRIATVMLEAWFLGDSIALETVFPRLSSRRIGAKAKYRNPDGCVRPSYDLDSELKAAGYESGYLKLNHSTQIGPHLNLGEGQNHSHSFQVTLTMLKNLLSE